jgi:hypothetical protein
MIEHPVPAMQMDARSPIGASCLESGTMHVRLECYLRICARFISKQQGAERHAWRCPNLRGPPEGGRSNTPRRRLWMVGIECWAT